MEDDYAFGIKMPCGGLLHYSFHALHEAQDFLSKQTIPGLKVVKVKILKFKKWKKLKK
jgi:hypothetical protein